MIGLHEWVSAPPTHIASYAKKRREKATRTAAEGVDADSGFVNRRAEMQSKRGTATNIAKKRPAFSGTRISFTLQL